MKRLMERLWPAIGLATVVFTGWLLFKELHGHSLAEILIAVRAISLSRWALAILCTTLAYAALAWYDQIALAHLGYQLSWRFVGLVSFTTYALAHNVGATLFSGAVVRYRAYSAKGLSAAEVGVIVGFTSLTFTLGNLLTGALTLLIDPSALHRWVNWPLWSSRLIVLGLLAGPWAYVLGALFHFRPVTIAGFSLIYPRPPIAARQLLVAPIELIGAAGIIYFALPPEVNPGFLDVLGVFLISFTISLVSHAPGGLGVLEFSFLKAMPDVPPTDVIAALLVFRLLYLIAPLLISLGIVAVYENGRLREAMRQT